MQSTEQPSTESQQPYPTAQYTRATTVLPHHRFKHSLGAPLIRIVANIKQLFSSPSNHNGANHQHLILDNIQLESSEGMPEGMEVSAEVFVAIRFGDDEGLVDPVPFEEGKKTRMQGEYIDSSKAYPTEDNPGIAVLHFTHHPVGFVEFPVEDGAVPKHYS